MIHTAKYEYNRHNPRLWKVTCTCGWWHIGSREECESRFSGHDIPEWIEDVREPEWRKRLNEIKGRGT